MVMEKTPKSVNHVCCSYSWWGKQHFHFCKAKNQDNLLISNLVLSYFYTLRLNEQATCLGYKLLLQVVYIQL